MCGVIRNQRRKGRPRTVSCCILRRTSSASRGTRSGRKWTWKSPDGSTRNCIDHILACRHIRFKLDRIITCELDRCSLKRPSAPQRDSSVA
ncbi:hypothetical protein Y032_0036g3281 [Ancylostoma ceylanicum]|uniref:Uncharacterized protein n=1 Tax=Ancylostoma ceylanicum TaxID=53326 RepID=A0A016ULE8_9BILA|nr:hypothetical protein Y032_0036g3281 [Ancylostoma ceylanicum]